MGGEAAECPTDDALLALVEGRLRGAQLETLDSHLDGCALCREVVATLDSGARRVADRAPEAETIGRFLVLEQIGEGAMGVVYAAYDPELDRKVALKLLRAERGDARGQARLTREAQALARLSHAHVVTVYDVGARGDDVYVAMELVEGESLRAWLAAERSPEEILAVFRAAGAGLAAAHDAGLVHRDFKPENVLVDPRGAPKVVDFGLARGDGEAVDAVPEGALLTASLTRTGALLGTPAYMAPEQLAGAPADARADQFAFCVALWEALEGSRPFAGETIADLREAIDEGPPPGRMHRRTHAALRRGLSPDPKARFPDLRHLLSALEPRRGRFGWVALGVAASLIAAGGLWAGFAGEAEDPCASSAAALDTTWTPEVRASMTGAHETALDAWARRWSEARVAACRATHVEHEQSAARLDRRMACLDRQRGAFRAVLSRATDDALVAIDAIETLPDPQICALDVAVPPPPEHQREAVAAIEAQIDEGRVAVATARHGEALAQATRLVSDAEALAYAPVVSEAHRLRASALRALARFDDADASAEAAVLAASGVGDDRQVAEAWLERVRVAGARGSFSDAETWSRYADAAITRAGRPEDLRDDLLQVRGVLRTNLGRLDEAEDDLRTAIESVGRRYGEGSPRLASLHTSLGNLLRLDSRYDEALAAHRVALRLDESSLGGDHPRVGRDLHNVAGVLRRQGRAAEARERYVRALAIERAALGDEHPEVALTRNSLGLLAFERGDLREARDEWERAAGIFEAHHHGEAASTRFNLGLLAVTESRWTDGEAHARRAIAIDEARIGPRSKRVASAHVLLARALVGQGRADEAQEAAARAIEIAGELGDPELTREARAALGESAEGGGAREEVAPRPGRVARPEPPAPSLPTPPPSTLPVRRPAGSGSYGAGQAWD